MFLRSISRANLTSDIRDKKIVTLTSRDVELSPINRTTDHHMSRYHRSYQDKKIKNKSYNIIFVTAMNLFDTITDSWWSRSTSMDLISFDQLIVFFEMFSWWTAFLMYRSRTQLAARIAFDFDKLKICEVLSTDGPIENWHGKKKRKYIYVYINIHIYIYEYILKYTKSCLTLSRYFEDPRRFWHKTRKSFLSIQILHCITRASESFRDVIIDWLCLSPLQWCLFLFPPTCQIIWREIRIDQICMDFQTSDKSERINHIFYLVTLSVTMWSVMSVLLWRTFFDHNEILWIVDRYNH